MPEGSAGWHPDPAGVPGRFRYWDGSQWTTVTTDDPREPPPGETGQAGPTSSSKGESPRSPLRSRRLALIIGALVVLLATVVAVAVVTGDRQAATTSPPTSTPSGLNDSSPPPTTEPSKTPSATPTPVPVVVCPKGNPGLRADHPLDDRVYGGNLSFEEQPAFEPAAIEPRFSFAYDVLQQSVLVSREPAWIAQLAVGQLRGKDGFVNDARNTVESLVHCVITGNMYSPYVPTRTDIRSESLSIDGRSGWLIDSEIIVDRPDLQVKGDHVIFIVVRDGKDWGFFFGAVPIGNAQLDAVLATSIRGLRAS
jgi:hypothetical protein